MNHFVMDAYYGYRSRLDDILLVHKILEEIPLKMGLKAVAPPFILPYYDGVVPEDCGISGFVFLAGGHFTIHTFSYRESYFVDVLYPESFDQDKMESLLKNAFPTEKYSAHMIERSANKNFPLEIGIDQQMDFGPHLFLDFDNYKGPKNLDDLFVLFDTMPYKIGMTPIIRPYGIKSKIDGKNITSILTMIAESHISLHYFEDTQKAYLDLFSCKFFDYTPVVSTLKDQFNGNVSTEILMTRGSKFHHYKKSLDAQTTQSRSWVDNIR